MADPVAPRIGRLFIPDKWTDILGVTFAKHEHATLLAIGSLHWDRWHLGRLGCPHPVAALRLHAVCHELRITSLPQLKENIRQIGNYKGIGTTSYALALAILQEHGYNIKSVHADDVSYITIKQRARKVIAKQQKQRKRPRRAGPPSDEKDHQ